MNRVSEIYGAITKDPKIVPSRSQERRHTIQENI
jgi:hypothetical protein